MRLTLEDYLFFIRYAIFIHLALFVKILCCHNKKSDTMIIVVGPEGGFSEKELTFLTENDFISVSLGNNVLRAETVPLYILSVINYEFLR